MKFSELTVLLPCHSLEDFPLYHEGTQADELLCAWCVPWHPALVAAAGTLPDWQRIDIPPEDLAGRLIAIPPFCLDRLPAGYTARAKADGAVVVSESDRQVALERVLTEAGADAGSVDPSLADDFLALGFCRLQIELLTRQMRYSVSIDETHFQNEAVAAARAAVAGNVTEARDHLQQCFDTLYEARKHFYPVDVHLLDITLLADTTLGDSLRAELAGDTPTNLLAPSSLLARLAGEHPESWAALLKAIDAGTAFVLGGEDEERELPLLPIETVLAGLVAGVRQYETLLGREPAVYARRRAGLSPALPQLLAKLAYQGALHFTLDDGRFPLGAQCKTRWEGLETSVIDIFSRVPNDAAKSETFLALSRTIADSMDTDHVATMALAHWPGSVSPWCDLLRRASRFSPVLGKFMLLDDYFMHTDMPGQLSKFEADDYRTPYLKQAIIRREADPISRFVTAHRDQGRRTSLEAVSTVCQLLDVGSVAPQQAEEALRRLGELLPRRSEPSAPRCLVFNPSASGRRVGIELVQFAEPPAVEGAVVAAGRSGQRTFAVVDLPSMGFAWLTPGSAAKSSTGEKQVVADNVLRNEFFEVKISGKTGGVQSLYDFGRRGNQLSQQLALRSGGAGRDASYTTMQADSVEVSANCSAYGEIVSRGALVDASGQRVATFRQTTSVWAGSRVIGIDVEVAPSEELRADPWNSYIAARFAWPDQMAELYRGVAGARQKTSAGRIEAPVFIDIDSGGGVVSLLTGGLPYHRRSDPRMLDTLLVTRGETARQFTFALGVGLAHPASEAAALFAPPLVDYHSTPPAQNATGWFFHCGAKNLVATHWEPIFDEADEGADRRAIKGVRVRLLETGGAAGRVPLRTFRPVSYARQVDFLGETILELFVDDDKIMLDFGPNELLEVEILWSR